MYCRFQPVGEIIEDRDSRPRHATSALHCIKRLAAFPSPQSEIPRKRQFSLVTSWLGTEKPLTFLYSVIIIELYPSRESLVSDIPAGDGKTAYLFSQCTELEYKLKYMYRKGIHPSIWQPMEAKT